MVTQHEFDQVQDSDLPIIQVNGTAIEDLQKMSAAKQDDVSATLDAIRKHDAEGKALEAKKAAHIQVVLERRKKAISEFDAQLQALGYIDPTMPDWVKKVKERDAPKAAALTPAAAAPAPKKGQPAKLHCPHCNIDGHDARARAHRLQKKKGPLSEKELKTLAK
jgi:hypothetical protein